MYPGEKYDPDIDLENHKSVPGQVINVGGVALRGPVICWWNIPVIENDGFEPTFRGFPIGDREQAINLVAFREIAYQVLLIIRSVG